MLIDLNNNASSANSLKVLSKMYWTLSDFWINRYLIFLWRFSQSVPNQQLNRYAACVPVSWPWSNIWSGSWYPYMTDMRPDDFWLSTFVMLFVVEIVSKSSNALIPPFIITAQNTSLNDQNDLVVIHGIIKNYVAISKQPAIMFSLFWPLRTVCTSIFQSPPPPSHPRSDRRFITHAYTGDDKMF